MNIQPKALIGVLMLAIPITLLVGVICAGTFEVPYLAGVGIAIGIEAWICFAVSLLLD